MSELGRFGANLWSTSEFGAVNLRTVEFIIFNRPTDRLMYLHWKSHYGVIWADEPIFLIVVQPASTMAAH